MEWEAIGAVGEVVGATAVVVTLIFLILQVRQTNKSIRSATRSRVTETVSQTMATLQQPVYASVMRRGMAEYTSLSPEEQLQFASYCQRLMRVWEDAFFQWRQGDLDKQAWSSNSAFMLDILSAPGFRAWFDLRKPWYDSRFVEHVEQSLTDYQPQVSLEYVTSKNSE